MLLIIMILMVILGIFLLKNNKRYNDMVGFLGAILVGIGGLNLALMIFAISANYIGADIQKEALEIQQETIEYKIESGIYNDDFGLLNKDIINEIQEWNDGIIKRKGYQDNFWIGIFCPNIYDDLDIIDYERVN